MSQELVDSVNDLTNETTKLLGMYADSKVTIDEKVAKASSSAATATVKAAEAKESAAQSQDSYNKAYIEADRSKAEADRSQAAADRAELVTGMDTAQQLVDVAVTEGFVPVQAQIDAVQADTKLPIVHAPLDNKLSLHAGVGEPVFVKSANQSVEIPAQNIKVGAETVTIPQQSIVIEGQEIEVPDIQQIKFSRASSAWLDGVEYGADEPRYTQDGKLVVEPQATNQINGSGTYGMGEFGEVTTNSEGFTVFTRGTGVSEGLLNLLINNFDIGTVVTLSVDIYGSTNGYFNRVTIGAGNGATLDYDTTPTRKSIEITTGDNRPDLLRICGMNNIAEGDFVAIRCMQVELGTVATSYIPSTTTAVTRAADIATINGQNVVSRWENDQQPIDTDTPRLLANGEHDMSADRLVKFERETSAWLDGKEYLAGEPRYTKDGKLLVEPQATNFFYPAKIALIPDSNSWINVRVARTILGAEYGLTQTTTVDERTYTYGWTGSRHEQVGGGVGKSVFVTMAYKFDINIARIGWYHRSYSPLVHLKDGLPDPTRKVFDNCTWLNYIVEGDYVIVEIEIPYHESNILVISPFYTTKQAAGLVSEIGILQVSDVPHSLIHCVDSITTVAADYAHVISKQAINTPTGLLPIGEHSVELTAIRSFKRDTPAWLDGVEYPANTPRYLPNGQLLIEPQRTAVWWEGIKCNGWCTGSWETYDFGGHHWQKVTTDTKNAGSAYISTSSNFVLSGTIQEGTEYVCTFAYKKNAKFTYIGTVSYVRSINPMFYIGADGCATKETRNGRTILEVKDNYPSAGYCTVVYHVVAGHSAVLTDFYAHLKSAAVVGDTFEFALLQVERGENLDFGASSYIPMTSLVNATRAADECFVDYQLPPNTYRDLKGFKA